MSWRDSTRLCSKTYVRLVYVRNTSPYAWYVHARTIEGYKYEFFFWGFFYWGWGPFRRGAGGWGVVPDLPNGFVSWLWLLFLIKFIVGSVSLHREPLNIINEFRLPRAMVLRQIYIGSRSMTISKFECRGWCLLANLLSSMTP
jgi:hypothetical protein